MTTAPPAPNASRFRRRTAPTVRPRRPSAWQTVEPWTPLDTAELDAMPDGTRRAIKVGDLRLTVVKRGALWVVLCRSHVPSAKLAGLPSAPRVPVGQ